MILAWVNIGSGNKFFFDSTKPLPEPHHQLWFCGIHLRAIWRTYAFKQYHEFEDYIFQISFAQTYFMQCVADIEQ